MLMCVSVVAAGASSVVVGHPLDTVKVLQTHHSTFTQIVNAEYEDQCSRF